MTRGCVMGMSNSWSSEACDEKGLSYSGWCRRQTLFDWSSILFYPSAPPHERFLKSTLTNLLPISSGTAQWRLHQGSRVSKAIVVVWCASCCTGHKSTVILEISSRWRRLAVNFHPQSKERPANANLPDPPHGDATSMDKNEIVQCDGSTSRSLFQPAPHLWCCPLSETWSK